MADGIATRVEESGDGLRLVVEVQEAKFAGKAATFELRQQVRVKRSSPVHKARTLASQKLQLRQGRQEIELPALPSDAFTYAGDEIDIQLVGKLEIDDGLIFDTKIEVGLAVESRLPPRQPADPDHKSIHSPGDSFNFFANLRAIPAKARLIVLWLLMLGGPVIAFNAVVGVRDQFVADDRVWFYDHEGDDGGESPALKALAGSGGVGLVIWLAIRRQLAKYMSFSAQLPASVPLRREVSLHPSTVFAGSARVPLEGVVLRLVAYNREHGQYTKQEKDGNSTKTVTCSFDSPACGVVLYEETLPRVPPNQTLEDVVAGEIRFDPLFAVLYPPFMVGGSHGLSLELEAQLLHPEYVDQEVRIPVGEIEVADFYDGAAGSGHSAA